MTPKQAIKILKHYNLWRTFKDDYSIEMPNPKDITIAINKAIEIMEKSK